MPTNEGELSLIPSERGWFVSLDVMGQRLPVSYGDKTPGVLGLKNHGNTCFMNAVVQCLSNTDLLAEYLGLEQYKSDISQRRINGVVKTEETSQALGEVTEQLAALVRALWTLEYTPQLSVEFKMIVSKYATQFRGNSQHDALEFLLWLLDRIHEDVNSSSPSSCGNDRSKTCGKVHSTVQYISVLVFFRSSLTCPHCLKQSHTFDPFLCISLPIPLRQTSPHMIFTLCLQLAPDDAWKCPHCKQLQQGMLQMSLWTLPDILILHLKRFRQVGERRNKLSTLVRFPLTGLDMAPHMVKRSNSSQHAQDFLYDLYAVCNHHGGMHGGHYTAYCRNSVDGQWYGYDDSSVEPVPEGEVCTRGAYILFYQRRNSIPTIGL
uniref:ubiquitinyl hydrolase 1 n=1 Tax=Electrophorus electricus TaxID=8005 RepID=A0A4W4E9S0_ELEEL